MSKIAEQCYHRDTNKDLCLKKIIPLNMRDTLNSRSFIFISKKNDYRVVKKSSINLQYKNISFYKNSLKFINKNREIGFSVLKKENQNV